MTLDESKILGFAITFVSAIFWYWLRARDKRLDKIEHEQDLIKERYQKREDARRDFDIIRGMFSEIKQQIQHIDEKLDRKADK